jgi:multidrug efflux pump subunit AcrA (membrane-fusion protein)
MPTPPFVAAPAAAPAPSAAGEALALYAQVLAARSLDAAAHAVVAQLARQPGCRRVSLGWHERGRTRLLASSHGDLSQTQAELPLRLVGAMDEALEQAVVLSWPDADTPLGLLAPIRIELAQWQRAVGGWVAAVPLGLAGERQAVLCVEYDQAPPCAAAQLGHWAELMQLALPALGWLQRDQWPLWRRALRAAQQRWADSRRPDQRGRRLGWAAAGVLVLGLALAPLEQGVSGRARVEGAQQRVLSAPADGFVKTAHVRPGDRVKAGDPLVDLLEADLRLEQERWASQLAQHENAYAGAMAKADRVAASTSLSKVSEAQAQLDLVAQQLLRGRVSAPFDALVIQGDLSQAIGAPVRQGDTLLTLASTGRYRVIVQIDETDIARVHAGQRGALALSSLPWDQQGLRVLRIAPLAKAVDGRNVFEVEAELLQPDAQLRPGLLGRAELITGRGPPLWAWAGHVLDRLRLSWWGWLG